MCGIHLSSLKLLVHYTLHKGKTWHKFGWHKTDVKSLKQILQNGRITNNGLFWRNGYFFENQLVPPNMQAYTNRDNMSESHLLHVLLLLKSDKGLVLLKDWNSGQDFWVLNFAWAMEISFYESPNPISLLRIWNKVTVSFFFLLLRTFMKKKIKKRLQSIMFTITWPIKSFCWHWSC